MRITLNELRSLIRSEVRKKYLRENVEQLKKEFRAWLEGEWENFTEKNEYNFDSYFVEEFFKDKLPEFAELKNLKPNKVEIKVDKTQGDDDEYGEPGHITGEIYANGELIGEYTTTAESVYISDNNLKLDNFWPFQDVALQETLSLIKSKGRKKYLRENNPKISLEELRLMARSEVRNILKEEVNQDIWPPQHRISTSGVVKNKVDEHWKNLLDYVKENDDWARGFVGHTSEDVDSIRSKLYDLADEGVLQIYDGNDDTALDLIAQRLAVLNNSRDEQQDRDSMNDW